MEHPWLARAVGLKDFALVESIVAAIHTFAALPALKRLVLVAAAREVNECEICNVRMLWYNLELECSGVLSRETLRTMLERSLEDDHSLSKSSALTYLTEVVETLYECMDALDTTSSGTIDWTEFVAATLCSEDEKIWSDKTFVSADKVAGASVAEASLLSPRSPLSPMPAAVAASPSEEYGAIGPVVSRTDDGIVGVCSRAFDLLSHGNGMVSCKLPAASCLMSSVTRSDARPVNASKERRWFLM